MVRQGIVLVEPEYTISRIYLFDWEKEEWIELASWRFRRLKSKGEKLNE